MRRKIKSRSPTPKQKKTKSKKIKKIKKVLRSQKRRLSLMSQSPNQKKKQVHRSKLMRRKNRILPCRQKASQMRAQKDTNLNSNKRR